MQTKRKRRVKPTPEMIELLRLAGSPNPAESAEAQYHIAQALQVPLLEGILEGDTLNGMFEVEEFAPGTQIEYPKSFFTPTSNRNHFAYVSPAVGYIPQRMVVGDYLTLPTYEVVSAIDTPMKYLRDARWPVMDKLKEVLQRDFVIKMNHDGWHVILTACYGRNVVVSDSQAPAGLFTKRLIAVAKTKMARLGGGNTGSTNRFQLTDVFGSHEMVEDIRGWDLTQIDDFTRREILVGGGESGIVSRIYDVFLHPMDEFGVDQVYQNYWDDTLGGTMGSSDEEIAVGLDLSKNLSLVMPMREAVQVYADPMLQRSLKVGWFAHAEYGVGCLDNRICEVLSF